MKALVFYDQRELLLEEKVKPEPGTGQVLIKVTKAGLCQTQINEFIEGPFIINKDPHPLTGKAIPLIPGHEFGGIIHKVGKNVDKSLIGKQVAVLPLLSCGECKYCKAGKESYCDKLAYIGLVGEDGGFAEYSLINESNIYPVEKEELLSFIEPILVCINAAGKINSGFSEKKVLVLGAGAVGITLMAVWRDYFGADVIINDILPNRLKRAENAGLKTIKTKDINQKFDIVVDCAGNDPLSKNSAILEGFMYLEKGGILLNIGTYFHPLSFIPAELLANEHKLITSYLYNNDDIKLLDNVLKSLKLDFSIFIEEIKSDNIIEGYYRAEVDKDSFTRIVISW